MVTLAIEKKEDESLVNFFKASGTQMDLVVSEVMWPKVMSMIKAISESEGYCLGCEQEEKVGLGQIKIRNLNGTPRSVSLLISWLMDLNNECCGDYNFYILLHGTKKKGTKNVRKDRKKAGKRGHGRDYEPEADPAD